MSDNMLYCEFVGDEYIICECGKAFPNEKDLLEHLENDTEFQHSVTYTEYKCGECFQVYETEQECIDHQESEHVIAVKEERTATPELAPYDLIKLEHLADEDVQNKLRSQQAKTVADNVNDELLYIKEEPAEAEQQMYVEDDMYYIEQVVGGEEEIVAELVQINDPPIRVQSKPRGERHHVQVTRGSREPLKRRKKSYNTKNIVCEVCGKKYASAAALRYHQRVHTGVRPYQCPHCPKNFTMGLFLQIHIRTHTGERPFQCSQCPKAFSNKAALLRHDRVHTGAKPYKCQMCGKSFTQSNSMKLHVHTVHMKMPAPYKSKRRKEESRARELRREGLKDVTTVYSHYQLVEAKPAAEEATPLQAEVLYCEVGDTAADTTEPMVKQEVVAYELIYE